MLLWFPKDLLKKEWPNCKVHSCLDKDRTRNKNYDFKSCQMAILYDKDILTDRVGLMFQSQSVRFPTQSSYIP